MIRALAPLLALLLVLVAAVPVLAVPPVGSSGHIVKRAGLEYVDVDSICSYLAP